MKKVLIITYYWPPSGGSGVQRWMYFAKFLSSYGYEPYIVTVNEKHASYASIDSNLAKHTQGIKVYKTTTIEPLKLYSYLTSGDSKSGLPQGGVNNSNSSILKKTSSFIRGNFFVPDARKGWVKFAKNKAEEIITQNNIDTVITTGPPHSTHLVGLKLKTKLNIKWIADLRDPWSTIFYNKDLYRTSWAQKLDEKLEHKVLKHSDINLTVGIRLKELFQKLHPTIDHKKYKHIYNGYDSDLIDSLKSEKNKHFELTFIGLLTEHQPYFSIIDAVKLVIKEIPDLNLKICLAGRISESILQDFIQNLPEIEIINKGYVTHKEAVQLMKNSDCLFNCLAEMENDEILISGKQMEYISTGNPILCFGNTEGESAMLLNQLDYACMLHKDEIINASQFIQNLYSHWFKNIPLLNNTEQSFIKSKSRRETTKKLALLLDQLQDN